MVNSILRKLLLWGFDQLYTRFAWAYDSVAALASLGEWQQWVRAVISFVQGERVLEIAHGSGHLYRALRDAGHCAIAIDRSAAMARLLRHRSNGTALQAQADARHLPFADATFDSIVTTFPTPFVRDPRAIREARRVLRPGGRWVIMPAVVWRGGHPLVPVLRWAHRFTSGGHEPLSAVRQVAECGFDCTSWLYPVGRADAIIWTCVKLPEAPGA
ncbi:MAG: class I SAM-dependent methyltransferase [Thermoflexales bacterium]